MIKQIRLKTERLEIVPQSLEYLDSTYAYACDRVNMRFMIFLPVDSIEETADFLRGAEAEWQSENPHDLECAIFCKGVHIDFVKLVFSESPVHFHGAHRCDYYRRVGF